jgi:PIN domain nuclease of toxin-antitoxin system
MRLLLDTHSFLWFFAGSPQMSLTARSLIEDQANELWLSTASLWEMAIKLSVGKLTLSGPFGAIVPLHLAAADIGLLNIDLSHLVAVAALPLHHRDPFDRMLIAQAIVEGLPIISVDAAFDAYGVNRLW